LVWQGCLKAKGPFEGKVCLKELLLSKRLFQVHTLRLDVFCRRSAQIDILQDLQYTPLKPGYSSAGTNLMTLLHHPIGSAEFNQEFEFAGFERVSVGLMQSVFEVLTQPGDIVLDWAVGGGASFTAGNFLNRFVIGAEQRSKFYNFAKNSLQTLLHKKPPRTSTVAKKTAEGHNALCSNEEGENELREGIAIHAVRKLKAMPTSNSKLGEDSDE
jgi:hypothetical protein